MSKSKAIMLGGLLMGPVVLWGCSKQPEPSEQIPYVMVVQPKASGLQVQSYAGNIQAKQQTVLSFRVSGQITERDVDVGDRVKVGQILAKLDVKDADLQKNAARAQLDNAQSAAKIATTELARYKQLLPSNAVSRSQYDSVANQYDAAQSQLKQAQANYSVAANQTGYNQLRANQAGVITQRAIETGQVVAAGQTVYQMAIDGDREVVIGVPEQVVSQLKVNQPATVTLWSQANARLDGFVREISPAANQNRTFTVKIALKSQSANIQLGQSARVFFSTSAPADLTVPLSSVTAENNQPYVWVINPNNTLRKVPVKLGGYDRDSVPVLSGLKATDWVVVGGVHMLHAQQKIKPIDRDNRPVTVRAGG